MWGARLCKPRRFARTFCQKKQHITLVFDVNRTILIEDKAAGKNQRDELATIIASYCSGTIEQSPSGELTWRLASDQLGLPNKSKGHLSYYDFLRKIFPFPTLNETNENNHQLIENIKKKRREMKKCFFDSGQPGERLFFHLQKLLENSIHENGFSLLPSFYETIIHFLTKQKNIEISICFRTFGDDLAQIQKEWNLFCLGKHPSYRNFIFPQLQLEKKNMGCFFRNGPKSENSFLLMGTTKAPNLKENMNLWKKENNNKEIKIFSGFSEIDNFFQSSFKEKTSLGIRDFYPWWVSQAEKSNSGKLFFIINEKEESENGWDKYDNFLFFFLFFVIVFVLFLLLFFLFLFLFLIFFFFFLFSFFFLFFFLLFVLFFPLFPPLFFFFSSFVSSPFVFIPLLFDFSF